MAAPKHTTRHATSSTPLQRFRAKVRRNPGAVPIIAEGDSWFSFPRWLRTNVIDLLIGYNGTHAAWLNLASNGHEARKMMAGKQYREMSEILANSRNPVSGILFSGGGNDIVGKSFLGFLKSFRPGMSWRACIDHGAFDARIQEIEDAYMKLIELRNTERPDAKIFIHAYDWATPSGKPIRILFLKVGPWVKNYMVEKGIVDENKQQRILTYMLESLAKMQKNLATNNRHVIQVPTQGTLNPDTEWGDEIHPTTSGFAKITGVFQKTLRRHFRTLPASDPEKWQQLIRRISPNLEKRPTAGLRRGR